MVYSHATVAESAAAIVRSSATVLASEAIETAFAMASEAKAAKAVSADSAIATTSTVNSSNNLFSQVICYETTFWERAKVILKKFIDDYVHSRSTPELKQKTWKLRTSFSPETRGRLERIERLAIKLNSQFLVVAALQRAINSLKADEELYHKDCHVLRSSKNPFNSGSRADLLDTCICSAEGVFTCKLLPCVCHWLMACARKDLIDAQIVFCKMHLVFIKALYGHVPHSKEIERHPPSDFSDLYSSSSSGSGSGIIEACVKSYLECEQVKLTGYSKQTLEVIGRLTKLQEAAEFEKNWYEKPRSSKKGSDWATRSYIKSLFKKPNSIINQCAAIKLETKRVQEAEGIDEVVEDLDGTETAADDEVGAE